MVGALAGFSQALTRDCSLGSAHLFASDRSSCGAGLEYRPASVTQIRFSLPQTSFDLGGIRNVADAKPECIGRTCRLLLWRSPILLSDGDRPEGTGCDQDDRSKVVF